VIVIVYFLILAVAFFFLVVMPQRRRNQALNAFIASVQVGDEIITAGGIFGTIVSMDGDTVDLEIAPGVVITVAKRALAQAVPPPVEEPVDEPVDTNTDDGGTTADGAGA
jgi:preprotein translocase subunit YajC